MTVSLSIVSGRSGSGKTVVLNILEDLGYYCIDNLPLDLLPLLQDKLNQYNKKIAVSIDARNLALSTCPPSEVLALLEKNYHHCEVFFLSCDDDTLIRRFSETRRKHPLTSENVSLKEALKNESLLLRPLEEVADWRIDTTSLSSHQLRGLIRARITDPQSNHLSILFQSFGYKHGIPEDSDFIFDTRCLPNPYWENHLKEKTGLDPEVIQYFSAIIAVDEMYLSLRSFLELWLPKFELENRRYLTISLGCTGGRHRSVYLIEKLAHYFSSTMKEKITIRHRDI